MGLIKGFFDKDRAEDTKFSPKSNIPRSDTQSALEYVMDNAENVGTVYAPTDAEYLTKALSSGLSNERVVSDSATIKWDWDTTGAVTANFEHIGIEDLSDPGADRGMFWDDSAGAVKWFQAGTALGFVGEKLSVTDPNLTAIFDMQGSFAQGDVLYHDGTTLNRLPAGTSGHVLRTKGPGQNPAWEVVEVEADLAAAEAAKLAAQQAQAAAEQAQTNAETAETNAETAETNAEAAQSYAQEWATNPEDDPVSAAAGGDDSTTFSAKHWAAKAQASAASVGDPVAKALFDANTILKADTDDTPAALTVGEGTLVGRATGGSIAALNAATVRALLDLEVGTDVQAYSANLTSWSAVAPSSYTTSADLASTSSGKGASLIGIQDAGGLITATTVEAALAEIASDVAALDAAVVLKGTWDASSGAFPGSGSAQAGWSYIVSVGGTVNGVVFVANDRILAIADNASTTTYAANWHKLDYTDAVLSVNGATGAVDLSSTYQPLNADLTAIAALSTQAYGRSLLEAASEAALKALVNLEIGTDVQAYSSNLTAWAALATSSKQNASADLTAIAGLAKTDGNIIVGNGTTWVAESGATARTSLGLGSIATLSSISNDNWSGTDLAVANGGTGASDASGARTNLGLGSIATQNANSVSITGGSISGITDLAIADGGTGASTAVGARVNLKIVTLTQATYDGLGTPDADTLYFITDAS